jgi:hypothetical protein
VLKINLGSKWCATRMTQTVDLRAKPQVNRLLCPGARIPEKDEVVGSTGPQLSDLGKRLEAALRTFDVATEQIVCPVERRCPRPSPHLIVLPRSR